MSPRLGSREIRTQIKAQDGENLVKEKLLREHLTSLLSGRGAHLDAKASFAGIPPKLRGVRPTGMPHSLWELLEHMRIAQWDILEFSRVPKHVSPDWPAGYWPESPEPPNTKAWEKSLKLLDRDLAAMKKLVANPKTDLFARIPHGTGQTILREALLIADHNAYHLGQVVSVRRLLRAWKKS
jgi:DinB superfamily